MKKYLKHIVTFFLGIFARAVVRRYHPHVVMITGSVGKTSTKDAVAVVLASRYFVRKSEKSFNSEFGVPFTIFDVSNPWDDALAWGVLLKKALALLILPNQYPNMLVLEVGADRPGDIARIMRIAKPDAVVVTCLPEVPVHVEAYTSPEAVWEEEFSPAHALPAAAPLIVSADNPCALANAARTPAQVIAYGTNASAQVRVSHITHALAEGKVIGMQADVSIAEARGKIVIQGSVGEIQIAPAAAAIAAGRAFGISLSEALEALHDEYEPPPGRGRLLRGKNDSIIIDDSYNASPVAVECALKTLKAFPQAARRIAVLGDMLELGRYSVVEHERIGALARDAADLVVAIGVRARAFAAAPGTAEVMVFDTAQDAARELAAMVRSGDVVLVKGSQSVRTEHVVKALLAHPADAKLLVRQEPKWLARA